MKPHDRNLHRISSKCVLLGRSTEGETLCLLQYVPIVRIILVLILVSALSSFL